ncbi:MAG: zinc-ribbon domain-containing protein [Euryarchaeota archaeon]|nr:zinc-ribbon domain-containing protein [Euryarchaeota archaeon]
MADLTEIQIGLIVAMVIVVVVELIIILRKRRRGEAMRSGRSPMADRAYNSLLAAEKIYDFMLGQGIVSEEARVLLRDARRDQTAGRYDAAISKSEQAKDILAEAKKRADDIGSEPVAYKPAVALSDLPTDSEGALPEEGMPGQARPKVPDNFMQAKFIISTAEESLLEAERGGKDVAKARAELAKAKKCFEAEDYARALSQALRAKKALSGAPAEPSKGDEDGPAVTDLSGSAPAEMAHMPPKKEACGDEALSCPSCDAQITDDDAFCRKCGAKLEFAALCPGCGAELEPDDAFCRKCGAKLK